MLTQIFKSSAAELAFYLACGGSVGVLITILIFFTLKNRIISKEVDRRIPEAVEEYRRQITEANIYIEQCKEEIAKYKRIQAEITLHAAQIVKAVL